MDISIARAILLIVAALTLSGCNPPRAESDAARSASGSSAIYYPPLPDAPRIQYLTTFASERDVARHTSELADFVLGDKQRIQRLTQPYGVAFNDGKLYVVDTGAARIAVFDLLNHQFRMLAPQGGGQLKRPINILIDSDGKKYISDTGRNQVLVYDANDRFIQAFGKKDQFKPVGLAIAGDELYVVDIDHHRIEVLNKHNGEPKRIFGQAGSSTGKLFHPTNIAIGSGGDVFIVETSNFRVQRFTPDGASVRTYGAIGDGPGKFARPKGIAVDRDGRMYVGDAAFENVQLFDADGQLLMYFGNLGTPMQRLNLPTGIAISYEHLELFQPMAEPDFKLEYVILVASQFGPNKVDVFGFGKLAGADYSGRGQSAAGR